MASFASMLLFRALPAAAVVAGSVAAGLFGLELARLRVEREVFRDRLERLTTDYATLAERYNSAVRQTAVTELVVENGGLDVVVRSVGGEMERIETPYDPSREIYVDFALIDGRVWIRRVFDASTPPSEATVVSPALATVNWNGPGASFGQAVYRSLEEGRWVVSVSGSGALRLGRAESEAPAALAPAPDIAAFEEIEIEARNEAARVGWDELVSRLFNP